MVCFFVASILSSSLTSSKFKICIGTDGQKQPPGVFYKKGVLRNFVKFTGKHLCQSLFFNKADSGPGVFLWILQNF